MPGDIMLKKYGGKLISVSVSPQEDLDAKFNDFPNQSSYFIKKLLRMNKKFPHEIPGLSNILMRSIFVASSNKIKEVIEYLDKTDYEQTSRIFKIKSFKKINWNDLLQNNRALATKEKLKSMRN